MSTPQLVPASEPSTLAEPLVHTFKFLLWQQVVTPNGSTGCVSMLGIDDSGEQVLVRIGDGGGTWWPARLLKQRNCSEGAVGFKPPQT